MINPDIRIQTPENRRQPPIVYLQTDRGIEWFNNRAALPKHGGILELPGDVALQAGDGMRAGGREFFAAVFDEVKVDDARTCVRAEDATDAERRGMIWLGQRVRTPTTEDRHLDGTVVEIIDITVRRKAIVWDGTLVGSYDRDARHPARASGKRCCVCLIDEGGLTYDGGHPFSVLGGWPATLC